MREGLRSFRALSVLIPSTRLANYLGYCVDLFWEFLNKAINLSTVVTLVTPGEPDLIGQARVLARKPLAQRPTKGESLALPAGTQEAVISCKYKVFCRKEM